MSYFFIVTVVEFFFMPIGYMCVCELLMSSVRFLLPLETYMLMVNSYNGSELINKILPHNLHFLEHRGCSMYAHCPHFVISHIQILLLR